MHFANAISISLNVVIEDELAVTNVHAQSGNIAAVSSTAALHAPCTCTHFCSQRPPAQTCHYRGAAMAYGQPFRANASHRSAELASEDDACLALQGFR
jgi:hypothetical protein